jgi:hypothetical protein
MKTIIFIFLSILSIFNYANAKDFFLNITDQIVENEFRLSYGVSVTDVNKDNKYDFVVTGFGFKNLALSYKDGKLINIVNEKIFTDEERRTIGVAACDIDQDGYEEIYFLNTDTYSGSKIYSDRLIDLNNNKFEDLFEKEINQSELNLTAGRSVVCVDRNGDGAYGIYVANYGGPTRFYELIRDRIKDQAKSLSIDKITGGRAIVSGHILSDRSDIFAANERGDNFLYYNSKGSFQDVAEEYAVQDRFENGRGTALSDLLYRGRLDILSSNWDGMHRAYVLDGDKFKDISTSPYDGYDEIFMNNIGEPNKLFKVLEGGIFKEIKMENGLETVGLGTGAAVADVDGDGILELLVSHGESGFQPLTLYKADITNFNYLRIKPLNLYGAPARGATVTMKSNKRIHSKTIDAGSGYLCQMEPVAHYGIRKGEKDFKVEIKWTDGSIETFDIDELNKTYEFRQKL